MPAHQFWQNIALPGTYPMPVEGFIDSYPSRFADGRQLLLPIRVLPGDGSQAVASLIVNQASFVVEDALAEAMTAGLAAFAPDIVIGVPTLGLSLAANVARRLGHPRMVALGTSRKFWYRDELSEPLRSITSPDHVKTIFIDPRMLPVLAGQRVALIDDVISSGSSMVAVLRLLDKAGIVPVSIGAAMLQGDKWRGLLGSWQDRVVTAIASPLFERTPAGTWQASGCPKA